jgi:hypothetical protein
MDAAIRLFIAIIKSGAVEEAFEISFLAAP